MSGWLRGAKRTLAGLKPLRVPEAPARAFRDLWPGDAARGQRLLKGEFEVLGTTGLLLPAEAARATPGAPEAMSGGSPCWRAALHGFAWLRDLRALGTDNARLRARALTQDWLSRTGNEALADAPEVVGARLSAWLGHWDFLAATAEDGFRKALMQRLAQDARGLVAALPAHCEHRGGLVALKGAMAAAVALEEEGWLTRCLKLLPAELERQFLPDGCHAERSPAVHLAALQDLIELRNLLHGAELEAPPHLSLALDRAGPALRVFRHGDGGLACFNGTRGEAAPLLDLVLTQAQARGRAPLILPDSGFQRLLAGRTLVIVDCGPPPPHESGPGPLPRGADRWHHAGTLSFEMSVGRDRLIVNCGASPWPSPNGATRCVPPRRIPPWSWPIPTAPSCARTGWAAGRRWWRPSGRRPRARNGWMRRMTAGRRSSAPSIAAASGSPNPATTCAARMRWRPRARPAASRCASTSIPR